MSYQLVYDIYISHCDMHDIVLVLSKSKSSSLRYCHKLLAFSVRHFSCLVHFKRLLLVPRFWTHFIVAWSHAHGPPCPKRIHSISRRLSHPTCQEIRQRLLQRLQKQPARHQGFVHAERRRTYPHETIQRCSSNLVWTSWRSCRVKTPKRIITKVNCGK